MSYLWHIYMVWLAIVLMSMFFNVVLAIKIEDICEKQVEGGLGHEDLRERLQEKEFRW